MEIAETTLTLISYWLMNDFQGQHFPDKMSIIEILF